MKFNPENIISQAKAVTLSLEKRAEYGWLGKMAAPHNTGGEIVIKTRELDNELAIDAPFDVSIGQVARRFIPAFEAFGLAKGLHGYQDRVAKVMQEYGIDSQDSVILSRLAWVVILNGLDSLCTTIDRWFSVHGDGAGVPLAPLHLWALGEVSSCYLIHLDPTATTEEVVADAKFLDNYFGDYCIDFNVNFSPYTSLVVQHHKKQ
jgi:hypothetical protein